MMRTKVIIVKFDFISFPPRTFMFSNDFALAHLINVFIAFTDSFPYTARDTRSTSNKIKLEFE